MNVIQYTMRCTRTIHDEQGQRTEEYQGAAVSIPYSEENLALARAESWEEPVITDDGKPEVAPQPTLEELAQKNAELEAALRALLEGRTE